MRFTPQDEVEIAEATITLLEKREAIIKDGVDKRGLGVIQSVIVHQKRILLYHQLNLSVRGNFHNVDNNLSRV